MMTTSINAIVIACALESKIPISLRSDDADKLLPRSPSSSLLSPIITITIVSIIIIIISQPPFIAIFVLENQAKLPVSCKSRPHMDGWMDEERGKMDE